MMTQEPVESGRNLSKREQLRLLGSGLAFGLIILIAFGTWSVAKKELASIYNDRGLTHWQQGDLETALAYYSRAIELDPAFAEPHNNRGVVLVELDDLEGAIDNYSQAIALDAAYAEAYRNRGIALHMQADLSEPDYFKLLKNALDDFDKAIELNPYDATTYWRRGGVRATLLDFDRAFDDYSTAIKLKPDFGAAYLDRGLVQAYSIGAIPRNGNGAIADLSKAIEIDPTNPMSFYNRGKTYLLLGDKVHAIADFDRALELDPDDEKVYRARALAHEMAGNPEAALADYYLLLELEPELYDRELIERSIDELEAELAGE